MIKHHVRKALALPGSHYAVWWLQKVADGEYGTPGVPYWCQFATPEYAKDILAGTTNPRDDPNWRVFGYDTKEQAAYWATRQCGVICVKMILQAQGDTASVADLTDQGVKLGGYNRATDTGWYYKPLVQLLKRHGVRAKTKAHLPVTTLAVTVATHGVVIASVNPQIIRGDTNITNTTKSGHLVVVTGVRVERGQITGFVIHNPSGASADMRANAFIPITRFNQAYGERGIVIAKDKS